MTATRTTARSRIVTARALVLGTALAVGLTGCGNSGGGGGEDEPSDNETPMGAIDKMFEEAYADWDEETSNAQQMQVEELVAECMAGLGFEYIPVDYSAMNAGMSVSTEEDDIPWGTLEFAEQWGYGITTNPWEDSEESPEPMPEDQFEDPNTPIVEAMSETERNAYYEALWGPQSMEEMDPDEEWVEPSWEEQGCFGSAQHEIYGDSAYGSGADDPFAALMEEMNTMWESISTDDRILATQGEWAACMADAGHPNLAQVGDAEQIIYDQVDPIWNDAYSDMPPDATEEDYRAVEESIQEQLAAVTDEEIALAVDDYTCREDAGYDDVYTEVNLDLQQQFYDTHKAELEEWIAFQKDQQG